MTACIVIGCIVLFFAILFSLRIRLELSTGDTFRMRAGLGSVMLTLAPKKKREIKLSDYTYAKHQKRLKNDRKRTEKKTKKQDKKSKSKALTAQAEQAAASTADTAPQEKLFSVIDIVRFVLEEFPVLTSRLHTDLRQMEITVGGKDADKIARTYGAIEGGTVLLIELLRNRTAMKPPKPGAICVKPDFLASKTAFRLDLRLSISLFSILRSGWHTLLWFLRKQIQK